MLISGFVKYSFGVRKGSNFSRNVHKQVAKLYRQLISMNLPSFQISVKDYLFGQLEDHVLSCTISICQTLSGKLRWWYCRERKAGSEFNLRPGVVFMGLFVCAWLPMVCVFRAFNQLAIPV
jgi:hypothetical protein